MRLNQDQMCPAMEYYAKNRQLSFLKFLVVIVQCHFLTTLRQLTYHKIHPLSTQLNDFY